MAYVLLACAVVLLAVALRLRRATGIPWARVQASDTGGWRAAEAPLISQRYGLVGKPDYVLETRDGLIPIEVKPSRTAPEPYDSDLMQLVAYCLLIEDTTGAAPPYGLLRYARHTFRVPYTRALRAELIELIEELRQRREAQDVPRSHDSAARCRGCGFYSMCDDRLA
ncbi:MAG TPA: CRISPR-associated protein Cas4 [Herpetosiphonaceae bacterium]